MMIADNILLQRLRDEVGVPAGEEDRLKVSDGQTCTEAYP